MTENKIIKILIIIIVTITIAYQYGKLTYSYGVFDSLRMSREVITDNPYSDLEKPDCDYLKKIL